MSSPMNYFQSSIGRKQVVATTGLILILFVMGHLVGNLLIFLGPEAFNKYANTLNSLRPGVTLIEYILLVFFLIHIYFTALLVHDNIRARGGRYAVTQSKGQRSLATKLMPYTGTFILGFVVWHLFDFTFADKTGLRSVLADGKSYELYGVVFNAFANPIHSGMYILAMMCLSLHLSHGVESFMQTFGFNHPNNVSLIKKISHGFALLMVLGYSSIPIYIYIQNHLV